MPKVCEPPGQKAAHWSVACDCLLDRSFAPVLVQSRSRKSFRLIPGSISIVMTMIGTLLTALVVAREWERGTLEALMATPISMGEFLATKIIPYFVLGLGSMTLCVVVAVFLFGVPFRGSIIGLYALGAAFLMPALGQGLLISAATKNQFVASQVALLTAFMPGSAAVGISIRDRLNAENPSRG